MKIKLKRSSVLEGGKAKEPTPAQMEYGELAVNYNASDPSVFIKDSNNQIVKISENNNDIGDGSLTLKSFGTGDSSTGTFTANQTGSSDITLPQISYTDLKDVPPDAAAPGNGALNIRIAGQANTQTGSFTANQNAAGTITIPEISYTGITNKPTIPAAAGAGVITIKQPGTTDQSFNVNQSGPTEINLKNDNTVVTPGNGALSIESFGSGDTSTGTFTANQSGTGTVTLPQIDFGDLKNVPPAAAAPGNGTITITQPGTSNQTFTVNQSGNTTIALKNDNTVVTPGDGALTIQTAGENASSTGTFTANQSGASTLTLPTIRYGDLSGRPSIGNGTITIKQPGTSDQTFTVNQSGNTEINLKNDNTNTTYTASNGVQLTGTNFTADSTVVRTTGNQNIAGNKRFTQSVDCFNTIITGFGDDAAGIAIGRYANAKRTTAAQNIAIGFETLSENLTGNGNTAVGVQSLWKATAPRNCVAVGALALSQNNQQNCVAVGKSAAQICDAISTTAIGTSALSALTTGTYNTSVGWNSAGALTSGTSNVSIGATSMQNASISLRNTAIGYSSLLNLTEGNNNVAIGEKAGNTLTTGSNNICIGKEGNGIVSVFEGTTESNFISMGHRSITDAYVKVAWTVVSDERDKTNFKTVPHGLDFVNKLKPISYQFKVNRTSDKATGPIRYGFKAQDILELEGDNPVIIDTKDENLLKYKGEHLVPILVNAIQELSQELDELKKSLPIK